MNGSPPSRSFEGLTVLVTGASLGLGRQLSAAFHAEGANVVAAARHLDTSELDAWHDRILAGSSSSYVTGQLLPVDGGWI